jgi:hypothetical protein
VNKQPSALLVTVALVAMAAITLLAYYPGMSAGFYFDDIPNFSGAPAMRWTELSMEALHRTLNEAWLKTRPVANVSFGITHYFSALNPAPYHWTNLFIHFAAGLALFWVIRLLQRRLKVQQEDTWWALLAVFLFLVHPLNIQAVTYVVQRMTSLATLFFLLALGSYLTARHLAIGRKQYAWFAAVLTCFLVSIGSKEIGYLLLPILLLYEVCFHGGEWYNRFRVENASLRRFAVYAGGGLLAIMGVTVAWHLGSGSFSLTETMPGRDYSAFERVLTQGRVQFFYISLLLWPSPSRLNLDHDFVVSRSLFEPISTALALTIWLIIFLYAMRNISSRPRLAFPILAYFVLHSMESAPINLELVFEHRMYLPGTMLALLVALNPPQLAKPYREIGLVAALSIGLLLTGATYQRNVVWANPIAFLYDVAQKSPSKFRPQYNLGTELGKRGLIVEAEMALQRAVSLKPENPKAHNQLGNVYMYRKQFDIAEKHYRLAIEYDPQYAQAFYNLSLILASQHRYEEQKDALKKFIEHAPPQLANQKQAALVRLQSLPSD